MKKNVFISHRSVDFDRFVKKIISELEDHGMETWYSEKSIHDGEDYQNEIVEAVSSCDIFLAIITDEVLKQPGQVLNEIGKATRFGRKKLAIKETAKPIPENILYHFDLNVIRWHELTEQAAFETLFAAMGQIYQKPIIDEDTANHAQQITAAMESHTDWVFSDVSSMGGYSWGMDKSVIQNIPGGWPLKNIKIEEWDTEPFEFERPEHANAYRDYLSSQECRTIMLKGKNHTRWMLTGYDAAYDQLFLSIQRTEWRQTQFVWHHLLRDESERKSAIDTFFEEEESSYPTSLCLHLILIDNENNIVASRIKRRKKDDYPSTIAITIGEQLDETDYTSSDNYFMMQWMRRAFCEEFGLNDESLPQYVDEASARVMALDMEGDIYNFSLVCCVRLRSTTKQLFDYYQVHRSSEDEFDQLFPIPVEDVRDILLNSDQLQDRYHPSSFLRLLFAYLYVEHRLPSF